MDMKIKLSLIATLFLTSLYAENTDHNTSLEAQSKKDQTLNDVYIRGKKRKFTTKTNDITGLGKVVKTSKQLDKEQVLGIRDLTRYEPGIAVVEQGSGASVGYSMRGVDKNRVSVLVDGLSQSQSYTIQGQRPGSGAINEVEIENVSSVEFSKGGDSAFYGGGALGGAVAFRTKEASDLIEDGKNYALKAKTSYSSKNKQKTHSVSAAGRKKGFEILAQFTTKNGHEIQGHEDSWKGKSQYMYREPIFKQRFNLNDSSRPYMFCILDEDPDCKNPKFKATFIGTNNLPHIKDSDPAAWAKLDANEKAEYDKVYKTYKNKKVKVSPKDYTGAGRAMANPTDYDSNSYLINGSYRFNQRHKISSVFEKSVQNFLTRDMSVPATYWMQGDNGVNWSKRSRGIYLGDDITQGIINKHHTGSTIDYFTEENGKVVKKHARPADATSYNYTRAVFSKEKHTKTRHGFSYEVEDLGLDKASISFNDQTVKIDHKYIDSRCSKYPNADPDCKPSLDKPYSFVETEENNYKEETKSWKFDFQKSVKFANKYKTKWDIDFQFGFSNAISTLTRDNFRQDYATGPQYEKVSTDFNTIVNINGKPTKIKGVDKWKKVEDGKLGNILLCYWTGIERRCETRKIKGDSKFLLLNQKFKVNKYLTLGLALRQDTMKYRSKDSWVKNKDYDVKSYNASFIVKPIKNLSLLYRQSTGFRIPSYSEMFGYRTPGFEKGKHDRIHYISNLKPEKSLNKEFGIEIKGNIGRVQASYFINDYKGLISIADKGNKPIPNSNRLRSTFGYHNVQDMKLHGVNLQGIFDLNALHQKVPEGFFLKLAYDKIDVDKSGFHEEGFRYAKSYVPDAIQPSRYVVGLVYDSPDDRWGLEYDMTYSAQKNVDELYGYEIDPVTGEYSNSKFSTKVSTPSWYTFDLSGYYKYKGFTIRAGVYNIFDYKYLTWENVRQSSESAVMQQKNIQDYARYAAPGRNFKATFEYKF